MRQRGMTVAFVALAGLSAARCGGPTTPAAPALDAVFVTHDVPATLEPRQIVNVSLTVRNSGTAAWLPGAVHLTGAGTATTDPARRLLRGCDPTVVSPPLAEGVPLPSDVTVEPGGEYVFRFPIQAPDEETTLPAVWHLADAGGQVFGGPLTTPVSVTPVQYTTNPFVIPIAQTPPPGDQGGGFVVQDVDNDGRMDFIVGTPRDVGAYSHDGRKLWVTTPGVYHAELWKSLAGGKRAGVFVGDVDGDGRHEVGYVIAGGYLRLLDGATGVEKSRLWIGDAEVALLANIRGLGDRDAVLQQGQTNLAAIRLDTGGMLWSTSAFHGIDKRPARQADLDGDGKDEFCGSNIIGPEGSVIHAWDLERDRPGFRWIDVDSVAIGDIVPGGPLEVAIAEQGGTNSTIAFNPERIVYATFNPHNRCCEITHGAECIEIDPDKVALGNFTGDAALEFLANSACGRAPWVVDSEGRVIASWIVDDTKPADWTKDGIEDIVAIDWFGDGHHRILVHERWLDDGDAAILDPMTGQFLRRFRVDAVRVHAVDVSGDYREEAVILDLDRTLKVFWNPDPAPLKRVGYWSQQHYRRQKQNWGHYVP
jgi:hypothetical protein